MKYMLAKWWQTEKNKIKCQLCPKICLIPENAFGACGIRQNLSGHLYSLAYSHPIALQIDPIEKKPLYKFLPGTKTFSLGTNGCNLNCIFCQNFHISQQKYTHSQLQESCTPSEVVELALKHKCSSISFTYNEPLIWGEYIIDIAKLAKQQGLSTVLVSNAYINKKPAEEIFKYIDAANFDMKGFSEEFYKSMTGGHLQAVLDTIKYFYSLGKHLELTNLIIPNKNDSKEMINDYLNWVNQELDKSVPLHFSAFHPDYKYLNSNPTPPQSLYSIEKTAKEKGFSNIFLGNINLTF